MKNLGAFNISTFNYFISSLKNSYDLLRKISYDVLLLFPNDLDFINKELVSYLLKQAHTLCLSPIIRIYECGSLLYSLIFEKYLPALNDCQSTNTSSISEQKLEFLDSFLIMTEKQFEIVKNSFLKDSEAYHNNLVHGFILTFQKILDTTYTDKILEY